jgi:endonuclease/exonuclease/phosphatase family metal-dependent hydrolase
LRVITWNMGCAYGSTYKKTQARTWRQLLAWDPDIALLQETLRPTDVDPARYVFTPYGFSEKIGTLVHSKSEQLVSSALPPLLGDLLQGQVTMAEVSLDGKNFLFASIHAGTGQLASEDLAGLDLDGVGASHTSKIYPLDVILNQMKPATATRQFVVGGDLNASVRFDDLYGPSSPMYGNVEWFSKARDAKWYNAHRKFHTGDHRTLFRPGKPDELFQIDHLFTDKTTWNQLQRCDVLDVPLLDELSDHAPILLETSS